MARPREHPYLWTTWLAKLLAGEAHCDLAGWFRAHHHQDWVRPPSDFDQSQWMLDYTALVNKERESHVGWGYTVHTENQNSFRLRGRSATLAGKAGPHSGRRPRGRHHRHQDRVAQTQPRRTDQGLPVRGADGAGAAQVSRIPGPHGLRRRKAHGRPRQRGRAGVRGAAGSTDMEGVGGHADQASTQPGRMPVLRHRRTGNTTILVVISSDQRDRGSGATSAGQTTRRSCGKPWRTPGARRTWL